jgi:hypothetical protein
LEDIREDTTKKAKQKTKKTVLTRRQSALNQMEMGNYTRQSLIQ